MPLDLFITRATGLDALGTQAPLSIADLPPPEDATRMPDGRYRVEHPHGEPWLVVEQRGPDIVLSTSYSNRRFLRNFPDMFDLALSLAGALGANVLEEVGGTIVTKANVDALLTLSGAFVSLQAETFRQTQRRIEEEGLAPLEYPSGPVDLVSEYFAFHVDGARADTVAAALAPLGKRVTRASETASLIAPTDERGWLARTFTSGPEPATKVLVRDDGTAQIWPTWRTPFAACAPSTLEVTLLLARSLGKPARLGASVCDEAFVDALRPHLDGLGVDFHAWRSANP